MRLTFIVGTGRCGSTLLHQILARHPETSFLPRIEENHRRLAGLGRWSSALYRADHRPGLGGLARRFGPTEGYGLIDRQVSPIYSRPFRDLTADDVTPSLEARFRAFFERRFERHGLPVLVHKYTGWSRLGFFARIFPEAKFVHVVRDGRAVANSWLQMRWWDGYQGTANWQWGPLSAQRQALWEAAGRSYPVLAALGWDTLIDSYAAGRAGLGDDRYLELRYEDFVDDPEAQCRRILAFSELPWSAGFESQFRRIEVRRSRVDAYRRDLSPCQQQAVEGAMRSSLEQLGYPTGVALG